MCVGIVILVRMAKEYQGVGSGVYISKSIFDASVSSGLWG